MIVRLVLTETETTPDRELLSRLALRHRMRSRFRELPGNTGQFPERALRAAAPTRSDAGRSYRMSTGGSGNCSEIPNGCRS